MNKEHILPQLLLRAWPFPRGAGRLTDKLFRHIPFSKDTATVKTTDHFNITVMPNDLIGRHIYLTGEFDRSTVEILCNFADPGDTLLDIGANIGYVSACFLSLIEKSRAVAVEPQPGILNLLRRNLDDFGERAKIYPYALSDRNGETFFRIDTENRGASGISDSGLKIETREGGRMFAETNLDRIDIVKIDVEGHEEEVITSCRDHFAMMNPKIIMFEEHGDKSAGVIGSMFREMGYDVYGIRKRLTRLELTPVKSESDCTNNDYVAVSRTRAIPSRARQLYKL